MIIFGYKFVHEVADNPKEPRWCNTNHGNIHQRIMSLERVVSANGRIAHFLCVGKHKFVWI